MLLVLLADIQIHKKEKTSNLLWVLTFFAVLEPKWVLCAANCVFTENAVTSLELGSSSSFLQGDEVAFQLNTNVKYSDATTLFWLLL